MSSTLLSILADGEYHSGEALGEALGISRAAVWKQLQKLEALGLAVDSVKGKGYCLKGGFDLLDASALSAAASAFDSVEIFDDIDSTNAYLMQQAQAKPEARMLAVAERQSAGRGRRGRVWQSPYGKNLYFSLSWPFSGGAAALEGLSLAVGVVLAEVIAEQGLAGDKRIALKWPNDVLCEGKKLAGILLEMQGDAAGDCQVVIGIGLNVNMSPGDVEGIDQPWTSLYALSGARQQRTMVLASLLPRLAAMLQDFSREGFAVVRARWQGLDAFAGQHVVLSQGENMIFGTAAGVDERGALLLDIDGSTRSFHGGELSLRLA